MSKVSCIGKRILLTVIHNEVEHYCTVSEDCKTMFECDPEPESWTEIEILIRDAAISGNIDKINELG